MMILVTALFGCTIDPSCQGLNVESVLHKLPPAFWDPAKPVVDTPRVVLRPSDSNNWVDRNDENKLSLSPATTSADNRITPHNVDPPTSNGIVNDSIVNNNHTVDRTTLHFGPRTTAGTVRFVETKPQTDDRSSSAVEHTESVVATDRTDEAAETLPPGHPNPIRTQHGSGTLSKRPDPAGSPVSSLGKTSAPEVPTVNRRGRSSANDRKESGDRIPFNGWVARPHEQPATPLAESNSRLIPTDNLNKSDRATLSLSPISQSHTNRIRKSKTNTVREVPNRSTLVIRDTKRPSPSELGKGLGDVSMVYPRARSGSKLTFVEPSQPQHAHKPQPPHDQEHSPIVMGASRDSFVEMQIDQFLAATVEFENSVTLHKTTSVGHASVSSEQTRQAAKPIWADRNRSPVSVDELADVHERLHFRSSEDSLDLISSGSPRPNFRKLDLPAVQWRAPRGNGTGNPSTNFPVVGAPGPNAFD